MGRPIIFGEIEEFKEGYLFEKRLDMVPSSFHRKWAAGIDGNGKEGASAIVLSGGYEDDADFGDVIIYTGAGGNDQNKKKQIEDQSWENIGNAGLRKSMDAGLPVRVIRGHQHKSEYSPKKGYLYAGLYSVVEAWEEIGKSNFKICRFKLVYSGGNDRRESIPEVKLNYKTKSKKRIQSTITRVARDTKISNDIKGLYNYECQVCGTTIITKSGRYAEGAHIRPLGMPHDGDDNHNNVLCLCPNHHVMFDKGIFSIKDNFKLIGDITGNLILHKDHILNIKNLKYHRKINGYD